MLKHPKSKGSNFERKIAALLVESGVDPYARRTPLSGGIKGVINLEGDLITPNLPIFWELKCQENWSILEYYRQAERANPQPGRLANIVVVGKNNTEPFVFFKFSDWLEQTAYAQSKELEWK